MTLSASNRQTADQQTRYEYYEQHHQQYNQEQYDQEQYDQEQYDQQHQEPQDGENWGYNNSPRDGQGGFNKYEGQTNNFSQNLPPNDC